MRPRLAVKHAWKCRCVSRFLATDWFPISASMVHGRIGGCHGTASQLQQAFCHRKLSHRDGCPGSGTSIPMELHEVLRKGVYECFTTFAVLTFFR